MNLSEGVLKAPHSGKTDASHGAPYNKVYYPAVFKELSVLVEVTHMIEYENSFSLKGDIQKIYHLTEAYFQDQGLTFEVGQAPNRLVFKKKGTLWTSSIKKSPQTLYVTLIEGKGTVMIIMTYIFRTTGFLSSTGRDRLDSDVKRLENMLILQLKEARNIRCSKCGNENPFNANYCNQCGEQLDLTRSY